MKRIPSSFSVLGRTIQVRWEEHPNSDDCGKWDSDRSEIVLYGTGRAKDLMWHTFWHEVSHVIFDLAGQKKLSENEELVDLVGGMLHQITQTMK